MSQNFIHKHTYLVEDIYVITEVALDKECTSLPFELHKGEHPIATGYIRWSDNIQTKGHSLAMQQQEIVNRAKKENYKVIALFIEKAKSAFHTKPSSRKILMKMKNYILSYNDVNAAFFYDETRLTRQISDIVIDFVNPIRLEKKHFKFFSTKVDGEWDENSPIEQVKLIFAKDESEKKSSRAKDYQKTILNQKEPIRPGSRHPYGYSKVNNEIIQNEHSKIVLLIFHLYSFGYSDMKIAELLSLSSIPAPDNLSSWSDSTVRYILKNSWYRGDLTWFARTSYDISKRKPTHQLSLFENHHTPLISNNLWTITQYLRSYKSKSQPFNSPFFLKNLIKCSSCLNALSTKNQTPKNSKKSYLKYYCKHCNKNIPAGPIHDKVIQDFTRRWSSVSSNYLTTSKKYLKAWATLLKKEIASEEDKKRSFEFEIKQVEEDNDFYFEILDSLNSVLNECDHSLKRYRECLKQVVALLNQDDLINNVFGLSHQVYKLFLEELRALMLLTIKSIRMDSASYKLEIEYRLTPYVEIEETVSNIKNVN